MSPLADGDLHLDDPVTRGAVALLVARIRARWPVTPGADSLEAGSAPASNPRSSGRAAEYADIGERHYLAKAAAVAGELGLPARDGGRFEPQAFATGWESLRALRGLARSVGAIPVVSAEP
jgi:hypothetical protein